MTEFGTNQCLEMSKLRSKVTASEGENLQCVKVKIKSATMGKVHL